MVDLTTPFRVGSIELRNRLYRAPVLEGAGSAPDPAAVYARHFVPNARAGVALIVQGNTVVLPEGRTSPGMSGVGGADDVLALRALTDRVHDAGAAIIAQLGHGGTFALESWNRDFVAARTHAPWAPSPLPWWLRAVHTGVDVLAERDILELIARFGQVARWMREAGYDGVQLAGSNAKLLHQFLSPLYNRRRDAWGGSVEKRFALFAAIRDRMAQDAGPDFPVLLKFTAKEHTPIGRGIALDEGVEFARLAERAGFAAVTPAQAHALPNTSICRGEFPRATLFDSALAAELDAAAGSPYRRWAITAGFWAASSAFPFTPVWNREIVRAVRAAVSIPVFAVGGIRSRADADALLGAGDADMIGVGRPFYAEPALPSRWLGEPGPARDAAPVCANCNACIVPQMLGKPGICYNPASAAARAQLRQRTSA